MDTVNMRIGGATLGGELTIPESAIGLVFFAHGNGSRLKQTQTTFPL